MPVCDNTVAVAFYSMRGGAPPYRGMKRDASRDVSLPYRATDTLADLAREISETRCGRNIPSFYIAPRTAALPNDFHEASSFETLTDLSRSVASIAVDDRIVVCLHWPPGMVDIGVFVDEQDRVPTANQTVPASLAPGAQWLSTPSGPTHASTADPAAVHAMISAVRLLAAGEGGAVHDEVQEHDEVIGGEVREALIAHVDQAWAKASFDSDGRDASTIANGRVHTLAQSVQAGSGRDDFKTLLTREQLRAMAGEEAYGRIAAALSRTGESGTYEPDAIAVRRTVGTGRWIGFHTDRAWRTVQVPLTADATGLGGCLVHAIVDGPGSARLAAAPRRAGCMLVHDGDAVHGVTRLVGGVRYGLYALRARENDM